MKAVFIHKEKDLLIANVKNPFLARHDIKGKVERRGICGSDLHYFNHGGFGTTRLKEPMILGHEVYGTVLEFGEAVENIEIGDLVAISPSRSCAACQFCLSGNSNYCNDMKFYGSAMPFPHIQGAFREELVVQESQCVLANGLDFSEAAMLEPLAVVLHAIKQGGQLIGKNVLMTGCGPIGLLAILVSKLAGAKKIIVTDISDKALELAGDLGAAETVNVANGSSKLKKFQTNKGVFDIMFECSGSEMALLGSMSAIKPQGTIVQIKNLPIISQEI